MFNPEFAIDNGIRRQIRMHLRQKKVLTYSRVCPHFFLPNLHPSLSSRCFVSIAKSGFNEMRNRIEKELKLLSKDIDRIYSLNKISPLLSRNIKEYILRGGKRARPILFIIGYLGFSKKTASGLYRSALSIELLHDFMLIHDDIVDKSDTRRGKPSMHKMFNTRLKKFRNIKFNGQDLSIVAGDVLYAIAIDTFLSIKENPLRKEKALKKFLEAAIYTGSGEFIELLYGTKNIDKITKEDIYKIYNYKTAHYTFACPLSIGAMLAGANQSQIDLIREYGSCLGKAFQIKDDILGMFAEESETGKSPLVDLQESKKTILVWYAYKHSNPKNKKIIKNILSKEKIITPDLCKTREIIINSGALKFAETEIISLTNKALAMIKSSQMKKIYKDSLYNYLKKILS